MSAYIEREALKNKLRAYNCTSTSDNVDYNRGLNDALHYVVPMIIASQPTEDVAPVVRSKWKYYHKQGKAVCMNCSFERGVDDNFGRAVACPNCGADMRGA